MMQTNLFIEGEIIKCQVIEVPSPSRYAHSQPTKECNNANEVSC